jgi:hypothetical protein
MPRRGILIYALLMSLASGTNAQRKEPASNGVPQRDPAETVFAGAAAKVVFLISFQDDEAHARASGVNTQP